MNNNNFIEENIEYEFFYKVKENNLDKTKIFNSRFIEKNKNKCKIIFDDTEYELKEYFDDIDNNYKNKFPLS